MHSESSFEKSAWKSVEWMTDCHVCLSLYWPGYPGYCGLALAELRVCSLLASKGRIYLQYIALPGSFLRASCYASLGFSPRWLAVFFMCSLNAVVVNSSHSFEVQVVKWVFGSFSLLLFSSFSCFFLPSFSSSSSVRSIVRLYLRVELPFRLLHVWPAVSRGQHSQCAHCTRQQAHLPWQKGAHTTTAVRGCLSCVRGAQRH